MTFKREPLGNHTLLERRVYWRMVHAWHKETAVRDLIYVFRQGRTHSTMERP